MELTPLHERIAAVVGDMTYRAVGELTATHPETVRRYMQGQAPSIEFIAEVCRHFGVNANWLLTGQGPIKLSEQRAHALREANPAELLSAIAESLERLTTRVDRIEVFVQQLEVVARGRRPVVETDERAIGETTQRGGGERRRARVVADAIAQRPSANAG